LTWSLSIIFPRQNPVRIYYFLFNLVLFCLIPLHHCPKIQRSLHKPPGG
jgi:hypothetical protein